ncbi:calcium/calmodulin-dependent protein kinase I [Capsaspora owczarzaki ATCC 30864]|nr:calcium/calmodulin-dependent protein kinase I [Capsaspora owczarzaki ATCC 30864]|eukprot:XP_004343174.2 calcium/calmodulin-dependent protein kinase I [Capsaspora owczarzaki ATCC 30864]
MGSSGELDMVGASQHASAAAPESHASPQMTRQGSSTAASQLNGVDLSRAVAKIVDEAFESCDTTKRGQLSYEEFREWVRRNPQVLDGIFSSQPLFAHSASMRRSALQKSLSVVSPAMLGHSLAEHNEEAAFSPSMTPITSPPMSPTGAASHNAAQLFGYDLGPVPFVSATQTAVNMYGSAAAASLAMGAGTGTTGTSTSTGTGTGTGTASSTASGGGGSSSQPATIASSLFGVTPPTPLGAPALSSSVGSNGGDFSLDGPFALTTPALSTGIAVDAVQQLSNSPRATSSPARRRQSKEGWGTADQLLGSDGDPMSDSELGTSPPSTDQSQFAARPLSSYFADMATMPTMQGSLYSLTKNPLKPVHQRYYVLLGDYLYEFKKSTDSKFVDAFFLGGAFIEPYTFTDDDDDDAGTATHPEGAPASQPQLIKENSFSVARRSSQQTVLGLRRSSERGSTSSRRLGKSKLREKFGLQIVFNEEHSLILFGDVEAQVVTWRQALGVAAKFRRIEDYYDISGTELGSGAFAKVVLGTSKTSDPPAKYAIKIIDKTTLSNSERESTASEIAILKLVRHPNVISFVDVFDSKSTLYLVMELCTGGELLSRIKQKALTEDEARPIIRQLAEGVAFLHEMGIVHRDLKPNNILFVDKSIDSLIKIVDFGYSKYVAIPADASASYAGTTKFWAPEILNHAEHHKPADIWSMGLIIFITLCAAFPFVGKDEADVLWNISKARFATSMPQYKALSREVRDLIQKIFSLDPAKRPTAAQILQHPWLTGIKPSGATSLTSPLLSPVLNPSSPVLQASR